MILGHNNNTYSMRHTTVSLSSFEEWDPSWSALVHRGKKVKLISLLFHMGAMVSGDHVTPPTITSLVGLFSLSLNGSCLKILFVKIELGGGSVGEVQS